MKININKYFVIPLALLMMFLNACNSNTEKVTETKTEAEEENHHGDENPTITSLTATQVNTVGITYGTVEMKELTAIIKANGNLKVPNNNKGNATSLYGGVIKSLNVQIGSLVHKGQVIATITNPQFIQLQEEYLTIASKIIFADQELTRQKELNEGSAGAKKNLQNADAELKILRTRRASLGQQIELMGINPNNISNSNLQSALQVTSPINGTISNLFAKIGSYVDVSSPVAEIVDNGSLHLDLNVFEKDLPLLKVGQIVHFTLTNNPNDEYDAVVYSIGTAFENESKTIPVHCAVKGNKTGLIDGMNITGIVSLNNVTRPALPTEAIVEADGKFYIFMVTDKEPEEHHEEGEEGEEGHEEGHEHNVPEKGSEHQSKNTTNFEKLEVLKGVSNMGYTAIAFVKEIPNDAKIVTKGAFFINAKLTNTGEHEH